MKFLFSVAGLVSSFHLEVKMRLRCYQSPTAVDQIPVWQGAESEIKYHIRSYIGYKGTFCKSESVKLKFNRSRSGYESYGSMKSPPRYKVRNESYEAIQKLSPEIRRIEI